MEIWVDADACPNPVKEILFRAAQKRGLNLTLVANQALRVPPSPFIRQVRVEAGFDIADHYIAQRVQPGDLVITADIPLADAVVSRRAQALNPRGEIYTPETIGQRLAVRNLMDELRGAGLVSGGPPALGAVERKAFADALDRLLARRP